MDDQTAADALHVVPAAGVGRAGGVVKQQQLALPRGIDIAQRVVGVGVIAIFADSRQHRGDTGVQRGDHRQGPFPPA